MKLTREQLIQLLKDKYIEFGWCIDSPASAGEKGEILTTEIEALADAIIEANQRELDLQYEAMSKEIDEREQEYQRQQNER